VEWDAIWNENKALALFTARLDEKLATRIVDLYTLDPLLHTSQEDSVAKTKTPLCRFVSELATIMIKKMTMTMTMTMIEGETRRETD